MAYAIMRFGRIKRTGLAHTYRHNSREDMPPNADPARTAMNRELIGSGGTTYRDLFEDVRSEMLIESPDFGKRKIRSDAAYGLEVLMTFSSCTDGVDLEKWIQRNVEWLNESFNPPGREAYVHDYDGTKKTIHLNNVRSVILHQDEGIPHLHAFIIPVDEKGVLNASYYIGGMQRFERIIPGFTGEEAYVCGLESRTSSPVRILRDGSFQSAVRGLYPCGEGAGYAGGIMSAAIDGLKVAEAVGRSWRKPE